MKKIKSKERPCTQNWKQALFKREEENHLNPEEKKVLKYIKKIDFLESQNKLLVNELKMIKERLSLCATSVEISNITTRYACLDMYRSICNIVDRAQVNSIVFKCSKTHDYDSLMAHFNKHDEEIIRLNKVLEYATFPIMDEPKHQRLIKLKRK